jgi:hypothetical protein
VLPLASTLSGYRPRRLVPLTVVGTVYVFKVGLLLVEEGAASNSKCILLLFYPFLCDSLSHSLPPPCVCGFVPLCDYRLTPHYGGTAVHTQHARCRHSFSLSSHPTSFHWATSPSRGPSSATADANMNLGDVAQIPARWDAEALEQFHPETAPH